MSETPGTTVVALTFIRQGNQILLVRQAYGERYWSLPGGKMEPGESIEEAAIREVAEETGLEVRITRVVGLYSKPAEDGLAVTFEGEAISGTLQAANEITECGYFPAHQLPEPVRAHLQQRVADWRTGLAQAVFRTQ
jgi:ADP-ribose pyrophosphatase YjhB (NUDIX family)